MKGGKRKGAGRKKGVPNKLTTSLKDAILGAGADVGQDGKGKDGLRGYLRHVASSDVKAYSALLGKVLPMQIAGHDGGALNSTLLVVEVVGGKGCDGDED